MIEHPAFPVEPWTVRETELHLDNLAQSESVFALSNGHIGLRGNLDEGEPNGLPGTYLDGFYETRPLPYAEAGYGYPEDGQTVVNVTNGKIIRLLVEDEPFDLRYGDARTPRAGARPARRAAARARSCGPRRPAAGSRCARRRLVSFTQRAVAAIEYVVEPLDGEFPVVVQSELVANETMPAASGDPRAAAALAAPLVSEMHDADGPAGGPRPPHPGQRAADGGRRWTTSSTAPRAPTASARRGPTTSARMTVAADLAPGQPLRMVKFIAYGWSARALGPGAARPGRAAARPPAATPAGRAWSREQRDYMDDFWARSDVEIEGDPELQQALRFGLLHTLQAGARGEQRAIAPRA